MCLLGQKCIGNLKSTSKSLFLVEKMSKRAKEILKIAKKLPKKQKFSKKFSWLILYISKPKILGKKVLCYYTISGIIFHHLANFKHRFLIY